MKYLLFLGLLLAIGCKEKPADGKLPSSNTDTPRREVGHNANHKIAAPEDPVADSLTLDSLLVVVLKRANENKGQPSFRGQIGKFDPDARNIFATYAFDTLFERDRKHLLVRRLIDGAITDRLLYADVYLLTNNQFKQVIADTAIYGYNWDSLEDVNGDSFNDLVIRSYSMTGCCPRDDRSAHLYNKQNGGFKPVSFFNPEFQADKEVIYQTGYGYPGGISIEKYRWRGLEPVKVEEIFPTHIINRLDSFAKPYTFTKISYPGGHQQIIKTVPDEYKKLEIYSYFISYQDN